MKKLDCSWWCQLVGTLNQSECSPFPAILPLIKGSGELAHVHHPHDPLLPGLDLGQGPKGPPGQLLFDLGEEPEVNWGEVEAVGVWATRIMWHVVSLRERNNRIAKGVKCQPVRLGLVGLVSLSFYPSWNAMPGLPVLFCQPVQKIFFCVINGRAFQFLYQYVPPRLY